MADEKTATTTTQEPGTDLVPQEKKPIIGFGQPLRAGLMPTSFDELYRVANSLFRSGLAPQSLDTPEKVFVAMEMAMELGLPVMSGVQNIAVINGRPSVWGDVALGIVRASGFLKRFKETLLVGEDGVWYGYSCYAERVGIPDPAEHEFTIEDAKTAKLWGKRGKQGQDTPWITAPKRMLQMRARGFTLRDLFPDVLRGIYTAEELEGTIIDVTPEPMPEGRFSARAAKAPDMPAPIPQETPQAEEPPSPPPKAQPKVEEKPITAPEPKPIQPNGDAKLPGADNPLTEEEEARLATKSVAWRGALQKIRLEAQEAGATPRETYQAILRSLGAEGAEDADSLPAASRPLVLQGVQVWISKLRKE